jgi:cell division protein FtsB
MSSPAVQTRARAPRLADAAVAKARLTVVPRSRTHAARVPFVLLVSALLVGGVVGLLLFNTSMQQASFTASGLEKQAAALTAREQALAMQVESLRNPQRVAERAQALGMVLPTESCVLTLSAPAAPCSAPPADRASPLRLRAAPPVKPAFLSPPPITVPAPAAVAPGSTVAGDTVSTSRGQERRQGRNGAKPQRDKQR